MKDSLAALDHLVNFKARVGRQLQDLESQVLEQIHEQRAFNGEDTNDLELDSAFIAESDKGLSIDVEGQLSDTLSSI